MSDYETYKQWKKWGPERELEPWRARSFEQEIKRAGLSHFKDVLEVGFGHGKFLQWAKQRGAEPVGLEIIPELVEAASESGLEVHHWNLVDGELASGPLAGRSFDCIVALDVIEHLPVEAAREVLQRMAGLLKPGGKAILRFPNGESPFYLPLQNGDHTHRMDVTKVKLQHLCIGSGLEVEGYYNSARVANKQSTAWLKWCLFRLRDLIEIGIGYLYYNKRRPLDPAATAVLRKG